MNEQLQQVMLDVADINALAKGLPMSLEAMEEELCKDSRFYVLKLCIDEIRKRSIFHAPQGWVSDLASKRLIGH